MVAKAAADAVIAQLLPSVPEQENASPSPLISGINV